LTKDAVIALFMRVAGAILWLVYAGLLARMLSQSDFSLVMYAFSVTMLATPLAAMGFRFALLKYASRVWEQGDLTAFSNILNQARVVLFINTTLILGLLMVAAQTGINIPVSSSMFIAMVTGLAVVGSGLSEIQRVALRAADRMFFALFSFSILKTFVLIISCITLAVINKLTASSALIAFTVSCWVILLFEAWQLQRALRSKARARAEVIPLIPRKDISILENTAGRRLKTALGIWPGDIGSALMRRSGGVVAGMIFDLETTALYLAAERIALLGQFFKGAVRKVIDPYIARAAGNSTTALQSVISQTSLLMLIASMITPVIFIAIGWPFLHFFGENYTRAYPILVILLLSELSWSIFGPLNSIMIMSGFEKINSLSRIVFSILSLLCGLFLSMKFGIIGLCSSYLVFTWLNNACLNLFLRRKKIKAGIFSIRVADAKLP